MIDRLLCICPTSIPNALDTWRDARPAAKPLLDGSTALLAIRGVLVRGRTMFDWYETTDLDSLAQTIDAVRLDRRISRVLLLIDSPGGTTNGIHQASEAVRRLAEQKPTVAHVDGLCCSAAYWIASQARRKVADEAAVVGSIGTYGVVPDFSKMFERVGIKVYLVSSGPLKGAGAVGTEIKQEHIDAMQRLIDGITEIFILSIARGRKLSENVVRGLADGSVFLATEAKEFKLLDSVGSIESALTDLRKMPAPATGDETLSHYQFAGFEKLDEKRKELLLALGSESILADQYPQFCSWHRDSLPKKPYTFGRPA